MISDHNSSRSLPLCVSLLRFLFWKGVGGGAGAHISLWCVSELVAGRECSVVTLNFLK